MKLIPAAAPLVILCLTLLPPPAPLEAATSSRPAVAPIPRTPRKPVVDEYHGTTVKDDYRWMEDWSDPAVKAWSDAQNRHARALLDRMPVMKPLRKRVEVLERSSSPDYYGLTYQGGQLFAMKSQPPKQQAFLITLRSPDDASSEHVVLDPNVLDSKGSTAVDFYVPSGDARLVAVSLSEGGSENGTVHVYETATGKALADVIPRVNGGTAGGSVAWNADGTGFFYTRYPRGQERPAVDMDFYQQVYFHKLGTPTEQDVYAVGKDFPRIAEVALERSDDGRCILADVSNGDGGEHAHYLLGPSGDWAKVTKFSDRIPRAVFGPDDALYLLSRMGAPRGMILKLPPLETRMSEEHTVVPASDAAIQSMVITGGRLYVHDLIGGPSQVRVFDLKGSPMGRVPLPDISSVSQMLRLTGDDLLYRGQSYVTPPAWFRYSAQDSKVNRTALFRTSPADYSDCEVVREFATSDDGTKVPINIIRLKGTRLNGRNPTLLTAYGGYGISQTPGFSTSRRAWLEQGGVFAEANIRGGGEYGDQWHTEGNLTHKQKDYDDFAACARHLIDAGYTSARKLAIEGGSNGGLLMGAALTQHPELYRAVVSQVGLYDMLRVELTPNGAFNVTEYGTVKDPEQFKALYAYSPYHHVRDGVAYPAVLFTTGANDPRVDPSHSRKMVARLQAASSSGLPLLLRTSSDAGHGIGSSLNQRIGLSVDTYGFLFNELGMQYRPVVDKLHPVEKSRAVVKSSPSR